MYRCRPHRWNVSSRYCGRATPVSTPSAGLPRIPFVACCAYAASNPAAGRVGPKGSTSTSFCSSECARAAARPVARSVLCRWQAMSEQIDCAVIGAGVVGLAIARELALAGREVIVLESADSIGTGISSRNSEVIHAGIYYPSGSLKARLCVQGRELLYRFCALNSVEHRRVGKLIVATSPEEIPTLRKYEVQADANGVTDLRRLTSEEAARLEPEVRCAEGLLSPSTGIVDSHGLMLAYQADLESHGGVLAVNSPVTGGSLHPSGIDLLIGTTT